MKKQLNNCCPVSRLFDMLGKKWMIYILKDLGENGASGFTDLQIRMNNVNSRILTERLDELRDNGFIIREVSTEKPLKIRYFLTEKGGSLANELKGLVNWAVDHNL